MECYFWLDGSGSPDPEPNIDPTLVIWDHANMIDPFNDDMWVTYTVDDDNDLYLTTTIDWGDATSPSVDNDNANTQYTKTKMCNPVYADSHYFTVVTITVEDDDGGSVSDSFTILFTGEGGLWFGRLSFTLVDLSTWEPYTGHAPGYSLGG